MNSASKNKQNTNQNGPAYAHTIAITKVIRYILYIYLKIILILISWLWKRVLNIATHLPTYSKAIWGKTVWLTSLVQKKIQSLKISKKKNKIINKINEKLHKSVKISVKKPTFTNPFAIPLRIIKSISSFEIKIRVFSPRTAVLVILFGTIYVTSIFYLTILEDLPSSDKLLRHDPRLTTTIYDRKGNTLYRAYQDEDRTLVKLEDIPQDLINATIAIEDQNFHSHIGLSARGIVRAAKRTILEEGLEGGSTITQQLVKNVLLTPDRTLRRKIKEAIIALEVERKFSKDDILEMYLNTISYGGTAYGVKSAAKKYFGKELNQLTLAENAFLAGLPAAPSTYSPYGSRPELGKQRQKDVLARMVEDGYIKKEEAEKAYAEKLNFTERREYIKAPHFVNYVMSILEKKYGQKLIEQGGLDVYTSLDLELQAALEEIVRKNVYNLRKRNNVRNGAALITNPKTGEILAMVGSVDYWDIENDGNVNVTISPRQPGSSIKPVTYSLALENGYSPESILDDSPVSYNILGQKPYTPVNYDGKFHGKMTLSYALANSYNIPAVKVLNTLGVQNLITHARKLGITTWTNPTSYGLSLTLGAGEIKMVDMATVYGTFANNGYRRDTNPILKVYDSLGNVLEENECVDFLNESPSILTRKAFFETVAMASSTKHSYFKEPVPICTKEKVLSETTAYLISSILSDNKMRTPAFGSNSALNIIGKQVAIKTGTTTNLKDNWAIGYTNDYVVAAWVGNNNGEPMKGVVSGYRGASIIWRDTFQYLIENRQVKDFLERPAGIVEVSVCPITNTLACAGCPNVTKLYQKGKEPKYTCNPEVVKQILENKETAQHHSQ